MITIPNLCNSRQLVEYIFIHLHTTYEYSFSRIFLLRYGKTVPQKRNWGFDAQRRSNLKSESQPMATVAMYEGFKRESTGHFGKVDVTCSEYVKNMCERYVYLILLNGIDICWRLSSVVLLYIGVFDMWLHGFQSKLGTFCQGVQPWQRPL